jgi:hypothetical protein
LGWAASARAVNSSSVMPTSGTASGMLTPTSLCVPPREALDMERLVCAGGSDFARQTPQLRNDGHSRFLIQSLRLVLQRSGRRLFPLPPGAPAFRCPRCGLKSPLDPSVGRRADPP